MTCINAILTQLRRKFRYSLVVRTCDLHSQGHGFDSPWQNLRRQVVRRTGRSVSRSRHHVIRNAHRRRSSDVEKRRWLDRSKKDIRLTYAAVDDATKAWLEHYTKRSPHLNGTNAKE